MACVIFIANANNTLQCSHLNLTLKRRKKKKMNNTKLDTLQTTGKVPLVQFGHVFMNFCLALSHSLTVRFVHIFWSLWLWGVGACLSLSFSFSLVSSFSVAYAIEYVLLMTSFSSFSLLYRVIFSYQYLSASPFYLAFPPSFSIVHTKQANHCTTCHQS